MKRIFVAVGFDYNGTVLNDPHNFYRAIQALFRKHRLIAPSFAACRDEWQDGVEVFCRRYGIDKTLVEIQAFFDEWFAAHGHSKLQPGIWTELHDIKRQNIPACMLSALRRNILDEEMRWHNLHQFFSLVRGGLDGKTPAMLESCEYFGCEPSGFVYIGDSVRDILDGKEAGCFTVAYLRGYGSPQSLRDAEPDLILNDWKELREYVAFDKS